MPSAKSSSLFFSESSGTGKSILPAVAHLDVLADIVLIGHFSISLNHSELLLVLSHGHRAQVAALDLRLVEFVEEGQRDVLVLLVREVPVDPFAVV